ncbi:hypothetical protein [Psychrobacter fozii]|uniref:Uncharacterized protein n=1 Tax=Psychrobacter fozii TaxID=198480 RepID=A0A2V4VBW6_9GAMM|nr:hypothetical protein [Psychrobacter fozii]PYE39758.1 hypothetical protein DFP82_103206 [Psychrobacter fozii]
MSILSIKILLFLIVPVGIFTVFKAIKLLRNAFNGDVLLSLPYHDNVGSFTIPKSGVYAIWHKGPVFKKTPLAQFRPHISSTSTGKEIKLNPSILSPRSNNFATGKMELFTFRAEAGHYELKLVPGSSTSRLQAISGNAIPLADIDLNRYSIEVKKSQSQVLTILAIPLLLLSILGVVGGLIIGLLDEKFFV